MFKNFEYDEVDDVEFIEEEQPQVKETPKKEKSVKEKKSAGQKRVLSSLITLSNGFDNF